MRYVDACRAASWHLMLTTGEVEKAFPVPYRCHSWRHEGECCRWRASLDFARIKHAIESRGNWVYVVLTYKQSEWWSWKEQYTLSGSHWSSLRCRLRRMYGAFGYIQTWERHKRQGIHVNLLLTSAPIYACVTADSSAWQSTILSPHAVAVGFGPRTWAECLKTGSSANMAGYMAKLASELVGAGGKGQVPYDAPPHFRRIRASRGILPVRDKSDLTGWLVMAPMHKYDTSHLTSCPDSL